MKQDNHSKSNNQPKIKLGNNNMDSKLFNNPDNPESNHANQ